ncbi:MAG: acetyl-CoA acetyltransferase [Pseudomonadota bacterium]
MALGNIKDQVSIVGMGCTKFGENWDMSADDMIVEAAYEAFEDAGMDPGDIQAAWVSVTSSGASGTTLANPLKLDGIPITRVENYCASGQEAIRNAAFSIACGMYDRVLALGFEKLKDSGLRGLPNINFADPVIGQGNSPPGVFSLPWVDFFERYGVTKETLAKISVKNHYHGSMNPKAHLQKAVSLEQVMKAPIISYPLGLFDCCPTTDGASAAILVSSKIAKNFRKDYISIKGLSVAVDSGIPGYRPRHEFSSWPATVKAAKEVYRQSGITNPRKEVDLIELHDCFSITELVTYCDLGLCEKEEVKDCVDGGVFGLKGDMPVNVSGGLKSFGHPVGATGIRMVYELYKQMQGKVGGERQVKNAKLGLAHNLGGYAQVAAVMVVGLE